MSTFKEILKILGQLHQCFNFFFFLMFCWENINCFLICDKKQKQGTYEGSINSIIGKYNLNNPVPGRKGTQDKLW